MYANAPYICGHPSGNAPAPHSDADSDVIGVPQPVSLVILHRLSLRIQSALPAHGVNIAFAVQRLYTLSSVMVMPAGTNTL